ncbi:MAG: lauroyl acyltransferase [Pseudomonadota bacterium]|nr:lauroyl acyltransferase [Pseudomonadota bacterium]
MTDALDMNDEIPLPARRANRPITLVYRLEYLAARLLLGFFRLVGIDAASWIAGRLLRVAGPLIRPISRRGEENLRATFPDWNETRIRRTIAGVWENLGRTAGEFAHFDKLAPYGPNARVEIVGAEHLRAPAEGGGPRLFVSGHFANWETMTIALTATGVDYGVIYRAANNPLVDELIIGMRAKAMTRLQIPKGKRGGRALIEALSAGKSLAMLVDQKLNDGIPAPFLGREAMTAPAAARLSLKFSAPIVPVGLERLKGARFRMLVGAPIAFTPSGDLNADVRALTILVNQHLERHILARPEQWLWLHRRWPKEAK